MSKQRKKWRGWQQMELFHGEGLKPSPGIPRYNNIRNKYEHSPGVCIEEEKLYCEEDYPEHLKCLSCPYREKSLSNLLDLP